MKILLAILSVFVFLSSPGQNRYPIEPGSGTRGVNTPTKFYIGYCYSCQQPCPATVAGTISDTGYYDAFIMGDQLNDCSIAGIFKRASTHADAGPLTFFSSNNGGLSWSDHPIMFEGDTIESPAHSFGYSTQLDRIFISWQNDVYDRMIFSFSDDHGETWSPSDTVLFPAGWTGSPCPNKMDFLPSGKILCSYYVNDAGVDSTLVGFMESTDNGVSWSIGDTIFVHGGTGVGDNNGNETAVEIIDDTGDDATTKLIAVTRNYDVGAYMVFMSADGGETWTTDATEDNPGAYSRLYHYSFGTATNNPVDLIVKGDSVYLVCGDRGPTQYRIGYVTASIAGAFENNKYNWSAVTWVYTSPAGVNDVHFGYPVLYNDWQDKTWAMFYDVSLLPENGRGSPRVFVAQTKIAN